MKLIKWKRTCDQEKKSINKGLNGSTLGRARKLFSVTVHGRGGKRGEGGDLRETVCMRKQDNRCEKYILGY